MVTLSYLFFGFLVVGVLSSTVVINQAIDQLLEGAKSVLAKQGQNILPLNDLSKTFGAKIFGMQLEGNFTAKGGVVEDLATLHRTGDVVLTAEGNAIKLEFSLGFSKFNLKYSQYEFKFLGLTSSGKIDVSTSGSSVTATIKVVKEGDKCFTEADKAELKTLGNAKITFSGPQVMNQFLSMVLNWVLDNFDLAIKSLVNRELTDALKEELHKGDICAQLPH